MSESLEIVKKFWKEFGVARGAKAIGHYARTNGKEISTGRIVYALNQIKRFEEPGENAGRLQEDLREHNVYRYQKMNRRPEVSADFLIPFAPMSDGDWLADLIFMNAKPRHGEIGWVTVSKSSGDPRLIFVLIHVASRKVYARAIARSEQEYIENAFFSMLNQLRSDGLDIRKLTTDGGSEFSTWFKNLCASLNIEHVQPAGSEPYNPIKGFGKSKPSGSGDKCFVALVERVNQTLRTILSRLRTENNYAELRWWKFLDKAVDIYNETLHSKIEDTPQDVSENRGKIYMHMNRQQHERREQIKKLQRQGVLNYRLGEGVKLRRTVGEKTFAGKTEGKIQPQQRFIIAGRKGSRYLLLPVNRGTGRVSALVPPSQYSKKHGIVPFWAPFHLIQRLAAYEQSKPMKKDESALRVRAQMKERSKLLKTHSRSRVYSELHPEANTSEVLEAVENAHHAEPGTHNLRSRMKSK